MYTILLSTESPNKKRARWLTEVSTSKLDQPRCQVAIISHLKLDINILDQSRYF